MDEFFKMWSLSNHSMVVPVRLLWVFCEIADLVVFFYTQKYPNIYIYIKYSFCYQLWWAEKPLITHNKSNLEMDGHSRRPCQVPLLPTRNKNLVGVEPFCCWSPLLKLLNQPVWHQQSCHRVNTFPPFWCLIWTFTDALTCSFMILCIVQLPRELPFVTIDTLKAHCPWAVTMKSVF